VERVQGLARTVDAPDIERWREQLDSAGWEAAATIRHAHEQLRDAFALLDPLPPPPPANPVAAQHTAELVGARSLPAPPVRDSDNDDGRDQAPFAGLLAGPSSNNPVLLADLHRQELCSAQLTYPMRPCAKSFDDWLRGAKGRQSGWLSPD